MTEKLVAASGCDVVLGNCVGVDMVGVAGREGGGDRKRVTGVRLADGRVLPCDKVVLACGPWTGVLVEDVFGLPCPLVGVKSSSIVMAGGDRVRAEFAALFCEEDGNGCHLEVYPRPNGDLYLCGLGGSDHVSGARLRAGGDCHLPEQVAADGARVEAGLGSFRGLSSLGDAAPAVVQV